MIERLLDAVSPELRAWLKEQKPKTAEELGNLANLHVERLLDAVSPELRA